MLSGSCLFGKISKGIEQAKISAASADVLAHEEELKELGNINELTQKKDETQGRIRENKAVISGFNVRTFLSLIFNPEVSLILPLLQADLRQMDQSMSQTTKQIAELDAQIALENERMAAHTQAKHDDMQQRLEKAREDASTIETTLQGLQSQEKEQQSRSDTLQKEGISFDNMMKEKQGQIQSCVGMIERAKQAQQNSLVPYGRNIKEVLERIGMMNWLGEKPVGPLGMFVKAKDPQKWGQLLRSQLGGYLTAFAVTNAKDRTELKKLLDRTQKYVLSTIDLSCSIIC